MGTLKFKFYEVQVQRLAPPPDLPNSRSHHAGNNALPIFDAVS